MYQTNTEIYTLNEARKILKCGRNKMLSLLWNGDIDGFQLGENGPWRIPARSIHEYIQHNI